MSTSPLPWICIIFAVIITPSAFAIRRRLQEVPIWDPQPESSAGPVFYNLEGLLPLTQEEKDALYAEAQPSEDETAAVEPTDTTRLLEACIRCWLELEDWPSTPPELRLFAEEHPDITEAVERRVDDAAAATQSTKRSRRLWNRLEDALSAGLLSDAVSDLLLSKMPDGVVVSKDFDVASRLQLFSRDDVLLLCKEIAQTPRQGHIEIQRRTMIEKSSDSSARVTQPPVDSLIEPWRVDIAPVPNESPIESTGPIVVELEPPELTIAPLSIQPLPPSPKSGLLDEEADEGVDLAAEPTETANPLAAASGDFAAQDDGILPSPSISAESTPHIASLEADQDDATFEYSEGEALLPEVEQPPITSLPVREPSATKESEEIEASPPLALQSLPQKGMLDPDDHEAKASEEPHWKADSNGLSRGDEIAVYTASAVACSVVVFGSVFRLASYARRGPRSLSGMRDKVKEMKTSFLMTFRSGFGDSTAAKQGLGWSNAESEIWAGGEPPLSERSPSEEFEEPFTPDERAKGRNKFSRYDRRSRASLAPPLISYASEPFFSSGRVVGDGLPPPLPAFSEFCESYHDLVLYSKASNKTISLAEWEKKLAAVKIRKEDMNKLVMNFFVTEGYVKAAKMFAEETGTPAGIDLDSISDRMEIRRCVQSGEVEAAIDRVNDLNPEILESHSELFFHMQAQRLIELIRANKTVEALEFAQEYLAPHGEENPKYLEELERTVSLLAFGDIDGSPVADLMQMTQRQKTASELNAAILNSQCQEEEPRLPHLLKMMIWVQNRLKQKIASFPVINDLVSAELTVPETQPTSN